eukprot:COSAG06_NODE_2414_length_6916_cov_66.899956_12_plen_69_part_00
MPPMPMSRLPCDPDWAQAYRSRIGALKRLCEPFLYYTRSFYQDRLGTNIGKALKKEGVLCTDSADGRP